MAPRIAFSGPAPKLILGIDIGTTFSGMSYCLLEPGRIPEILPVTRFPAQDHIGGDSKVPSILYYDQLGRVRACGAEALHESVVEQAEEECWQKAEWFKLHLRPATGVAIREDSVPPLPANKNALDVFADFLQYLFACAKAYIVDHYQNGNARWIGLENTIEYVLTHPNGWSGSSSSRCETLLLSPG
ncbi:hypothetical protein C8F04DRAFT_152116 [Mycena alexandri]|uniref:Uncharacterized protein n=1 Tax=Mycena alexandri TaxID=1745969 RepID=A0AAD6SBH2_9AGAR|nr:hypothetical protein C8F04DRAFT_152116 [Mycena alexandri]